MYELVGETTSQDDPKNDPIMEWLSTHLKRRQYFSGGAIRTPQRR